MYDYIIVGAGYAGSVCARVLAEQKDAKILLIDRRDHIAGNMYDEYDAAGVLVHRYGPHIAAMSQYKVYDFLSNYTEWIKYSHHVLAEIDGEKVPLPFNFTSIDKLFDVREANRLKSLLAEEYGENANVPILQMRKSKSPEVNRLAEFIYEKVFLHYTMKMWGLGPEEIDASVTGRIPVRLSYDDRHFLHAIQVMPKHGYTRLFEKLLRHPNIEVRLSTPAKALLDVDIGKGQVLAEGAPFDGHVIYTGALDDLFNYTFGVLPYRALEFQYDTFAKDYVQEVSVLNWPDSRRATRRTEMKRLTGQQLAGKTTCITEYPGPYNKDGSRFNQPYYPILEPSCLEIYGKYKHQAEKIRNFHFCGRLADYQYYNMDGTILRTFRFLESEFGCGIPGV